MNRTTHFCSFVAAWMCMTAGAAWAGDEVGFDRLIADNADALVSVKFVLKMQGGGGDDENEGEVTGIMIDPAGLIICSNSQVGGNPAFMRRGASATPSDIKVYLGADDAQGLDARMIARDSDLDLVWFKVKEPGERKFAFVDLARAAAPKAGDRLYAIVRLGKYFDRVPAVRETRVGAIARKPRTLLVPSSNLGVGVMVFDGSGAAVGLTVVQLPSAEELQHATSPAAFAGANGIILPASEIAKATQRAVESDESPADGAKKSEKE